MVAAWRALACRAISMIADAVSSPPASRSISSTLGPAGGAWTGAETAAGSDPSRRLEPDPSRVPPCSGERWRDCHMRHASRLNSRLPLTTRKSRIPSLIISDTRCFDTPR